MGRMKFIYAIAILAAFIIGIIVLGVKLKPTTKKPKRKGLFGRTETANGNSPRSCAGSDDRDPG